MSTPSDPSAALVPISVDQQEPAGTAIIPSNEAMKLPATVRRAGQAAVFAAEEFFYGAIRNQHTRAAYRRAVDRFLAWCESRGLELQRIAPADVGRYFDGLREKGLSVATRKQHLAAVRHFFDGMVTRHAIILNPALSVREERYEVVEGKTPEISVQQARQLLKGIGVSDAVGLRDRAILSILAYTSSRAGAVSNLRCGDFYDAGDHQWMLRFIEKGGKSREIPVRHDLQQFIAAYIEAAGLQLAPKDAPLFRAAIGTSGKLAATATHVNDICRMMKRRLKDVSLPARLSPHSFRVAVITDLLGVPAAGVRKFTVRSLIFGPRERKSLRNVLPSRNPAHNSCTQYPSVQNEPLRALYCALQTGGLSPG
jgi:site-specific recombinase XerD